MTKEELAYIAGFLDGDGCVMLQLVFRHDYVLGYQIRASIVFYQKQIKSNFLFWLKKKLKDGYIRNRNDGMSEYTIVGVSPVTRVLKLLYPFLKLKRDAAKIALGVLKQMPGTGHRMKPDLLLTLSKEVDKFAFLNYSKRRTNTSDKVREFFKSHNLLNPVETDS
jgi:intein-encoded DNA endonuclease-like protein